MFLFILAVLLVAALAIALAIIAVTLWFSLTTLSVAFSRFAISLLIATGDSLFSFKLEVFNNGLLNYLLRVAIVYGIICIASYIPRVNAAMGTLCTSFISIIATMLTIAFGFMIIDMFTKSDTNATGTWWFYLISGIVVIITIAINWLRDLDRVKEVSQGPKFLQNKWSIRIGRVIASIIYGLVAVVVITISFNNYINKHDWLQYPILFIGAGAAYVADLFLFDRAA